MRNADEDIRKVLRCRRRTLEVVNGAKHDLRGLRLVLQHKAILVCTGIAVSEVGFAADKEGGDAEEGSVEEGFIIYSRFSRESMLSTAKHISTTLMVLKGERARSDIKRWTGWSEKARSYLWPECQKTVL